MAQSNVRPDNGSAVSEQPYTLIRRAGKMDTMFMLLNDRGAQSSITSVATYRSETAALLTRDRIIPALKQLVSEHYALRLIAVKHSQSNAKGRDELWEGQLHQFDLDRMVEFVSTGEDNLQQLVEDTHNEWLDLDDHQLPLWRLKVVNGRHIIWYYSHYLADGLSGYAFQRGLLRVLNSRSLERAKSPICEPPVVHPPRYWNVDFPKRLSILHLVWVLLVLNVVRLLPHSWLLFGDLVANQNARVASQEKQNPPRCKTSLQTLRISALDMTKILARCRAHGVTFGALLHTVAVSTAAKDFYPKASLGLTAMPLTLRRLAVPKQSLDALINSTSSNMRVQRIQPYRDAATVSDTTGHRASSDIDINPEKTWEVARVYRKDFQAKIDSCDVVNGLLSFELMGPSLQEVESNVLPSLCLHQRYFLSISNLGVLDQSDIVQREGGKKADWSIEDVQFSAAAVGSKWGFVTPVLNVAGVKGGDCVINAIYEEGVVPDALVTTFLAKIERRLIFLGDDRKDR